MRRGSANRSGIAGEHDRLGAKTQLVVRAQEALEHPPTEEAGASGDEQTLAAQVLPEALGVLQDMVQVPLGQRRASLPGIGPDVLLGHAALTQLRRSARSSIAGGPLR